MPSPGVSMEHRSTHTLHADKRPCKIQLQTSCCYT